MSKYDELFIATTDTVLGLGAPISDANKSLIYKIKDRPKNKPLIIMVGSISQARNIEGWSDKAEEMAEKVWPGATTLVLSKETSVRMPANNKLCKLILNIGPVYMTSANKSGDDPYTMDKAKIVFKEIHNFYDFGKGTGCPSKIIDVKTKEIYR